MFDFVDICFPCFVHFDGYILDDPNNTTVMSERGTANLLGIYHHTLQSMAKNNIPKSLEPFIYKDLSMAKNSVEVDAKGSPYRNIKVYNSDFVGALITAYALAFAYDKLRGNQKHIGQRCVVLQSSLIQTALDTAIKEACGFVPEVQKTVQSHYTNALEQIQQWGFQCSVGNDIAIKKDKNKSFRKRKRVYIKAHQQRLSFK